MSTSRRWARPPAEARRRSLPVALGLVLCAITSLQFGAGFAATLFDDLGPAGAAFLRLAIAAIVLLAVARPRLANRSRGDLLSVLAFGVTLGAMNTAIYASFDRIPLGLAVTIEFVGPLAVAIVGSRRALDAVWVILAAGGIVLLARGGPGGALDGLGVAFALAAGACWAAYILLSQRVGRLFGGASGLAVAMAVGALVAAPLGIAQAGGALFHPGLLAATAAVALGSSVIPYSFEMEALRTLPAHTFGILMSLEPAIAALAGLAVLGQSLSLREWFAIGLVVAASAGATAGARPGDEPVSG
jgi:inner membrane transporter RhtA